MICPNCKKEDTLEPRQADPRLFECPNCRSIYSETFLMGYTQAWNDRKQSLLDELKKKEPTLADPPPRYDEVYFKGREWLDNL